MFKLLATLMSFTLAALLSVGAHAQTLKAATFNAESGGADPATVREIMATIKGVDLWGLTEVADSDAAYQYLQAAKVAGPGNFRYIIGVPAGGKQTEHDRRKHNDRILIIYNTDRFELLNIMELSALRLKPDGGWSEGMRPQLAAKLKDIETGQVFYFAVNHLKCCGDVARKVKQIGYIKEWANSLDAPAILTGDFNFYVELDDDGAKSPAFREFVKGDTFKWIAPPPDEWTKTQCSNGFNSMMDFFFVTGDANNWGAESEILFREPAYCIRGLGPKHPDHRPVVAVFDLGG